MFYSIAPKTVQDETGITIQRTGRFQLVYKDNLHNIELPCDTDGRDEAGTLLTHIYFELPLHWQSPFEQEIISEDLLKKIKTDISEAFAFWGSRPKFHDVNGILVSRPLK